MGVGEWGGGGGGGVKSSSTKTMPPTTSTVAKTVIHYRGFELTDHSPHSLDLAPSGFHPPALRTEDRKACGWSMFYHRRCHCD